MKHREQQKGFALITMLVLIALLMALLLTHFSLTWIEMSTTRSSMNSFRGFYAAEAGLNVRAESVRNAFKGFALPTGEAPDPDGSDLPCHGKNMGSGDFACVNYAFQERTVTTWVDETAFSTDPIVIPRGETFRNLSGHVYHYAVYANATNTAGFPEAVLEMHFKSRRVPLFQFAAFYNKDLEILTGPAWAMDGSVHTNGDLYVDAATELDIHGQVTATGEIYRGRKDSDVCAGNAVRVNDPDNLVNIPACSSGRTLIPQADFEPWNGMIDSEVSPVTLPPPEAIDPGEDYWDRADIRIMLDLHGATPRVQVRSVDGTVDVARSTLLGSCGVVVPTHTLYNHREAAAIKMLDVDMKGLLACMHLTNLMGFDVDDTTDGGLVFYLGVDGPDSAGINDYGVRVSNGNELIAPIAGAPAVRGLTVATNQAMYIQGHYNVVNKKPAAFLADTINVLSTSWNDANSALPLTNRVATDTVIAAGFLAATETTGGIEGPAGQDLGDYNGGIENFIRLHEDWSGVTLGYLGSFVSLNTPRHVDGALIIGSPQFVPPVRNWNFDPDFENASLHPPLSPQFVYLRQELFVRQFEL